MCGRYTYYGSGEILAEYDLNPKKSLQTALDFSDDYNVAPGSYMPVIIRGEQEHIVQFMDWGLVPSWSKPSDYLKLINARKESLFEKPMWRPLVRSKRCVVPARGFYEWKNVDGVKQPYYITPSNSSVFSFAGLYDDWTDNQGNHIQSYTIITTSPNSKMKDIHNRMPAILTSDQVDTWLSPLQPDQDLIDDLLAPSPDESINIVKVSGEVNSTRNNKEELIYPMTE